MQIRGNRLYFLDMDARLSHLQDDDLYEFWLDIVILNVDEAQDPVTNFLQALYPQYGNHLHF